MPLTLPAYRKKLINDILYAPSQEEVSKFINAAINALEQNRVKQHVVARFVDKIIEELDAFSPMNEDAQHWTNIRIARILFNRIKNKLQPLPVKST
jgi:hypothetical protein